MAVLKPFSKLPQLNTGNVLLVEGEERIQRKLADALVRLENKVNVNVRLAQSLPLPVENEDRRPRIDLVVFIVHLMSEHSCISTEAFVKKLDPGYFLGKVCFLATGGRCGSVPHERLTALRKLATTLHCPLLFIEDQTSEGVNTAAIRILGILRVSAGFVPATTALYLSTLTRCTVPSDSEWQTQD